VVDEQTASSLQSAEVRALLSVAMAANSAAATSPVTVRRVIPLQAGRLEELVVKKGCLESVDWNTGLA